LHLVIISDWVCCPPAECTRPTTTLQSSYPSYLLAEKPPHAFQYAVLVWIVRVVFGGYFEQGGECCRVCLDSVPYSLGDLEPVSNVPLQCIQKDGSGALRCLACRTCWLIRRMAMSLRSTVKRSNAASIAVFSVLLSTTRKFFWESGGCVTCYLECQTLSLYESRRGSIRRHLPVAAQLRCPGPPSVGAQER
jgi:hypothetical protein